VGNQNGDGEMERKGVKNEMGLHWTEIEWTRDFLTEWEMMFN